MIQLVKNLYYWGLDYMYVAREELASVMSRNQADEYRTKGGAPIIIIPGVYENWRFMRPIARLLKSNDYDVHVIDGLGYNRGTIEEMAEVVDHYILKNKLSGVTIIAHSKGGLIGKYLLSIAKKPEIINGLIALNTPFSGSRYAYLLPIRSLRIFVPNSKILASLAENRLVNSRIVSIYGKFDPHIPGGSKLEGAKNIQLNTYGHFRVMESPEVQRTILENIAIFSTHA